MYLAAIAIYTNAVKRISALQMGRSLVRPTWTAPTSTVMYARRTKKEDRIDRRLAENHRPDKRCVFVIRQKISVIGEAQRMTLDVMREAGSALCSREITNALLPRKGIDLTVAIAARIQKNILAVMRRLEARNIVREINDSVGVMK